ncbi:TatD family deoxyribonuclease [Segetibacter sp. 3557_3]|uniref:TatD family hydrolase n=1 Tax=Segetibacter sp. 3557_3 TaxID=2547429 RepID=UPI001058E678|nr:TatD family hydrolase [Segetibacter sp. 3557_3]TDH19779.1 TatD family deoxyribonuclease [Segetibacter sp. 3557_3]
MKLIDSHCHLYLKEFANDLDDIIQKARNAGVARFYLPSINSRVVDDMLKLETLYAGECFPMMGLHPCSVKEDYKDELMIVSDWLSKRKFVAVGEIGLDFYWDKTFVREQLEAFNMQMELALQYQLPIVIHSRNATAETIAAVKPFAGRGLRGIFHCFGDGSAEATAIVDMGFLLGIGGVVTYKKSGLAETLKGVSLEHLVLETDAPYLSPVPFRGKRNEPAYLGHIVEAIAQAKGVSGEEVAMVTSANAEKIFGH